MLCTRSRKKGTLTAVLFLIDCWHLYETRAPASTLSGAILHLLFSSSMSPEGPSQILLRIQVWDILDCQPQMKKKKKQTFACAPASLGNPNFLITQSCWTIKSTVNPRKY